MGAPNLVRGGSHSGNVAAAELARADRLDILSSDYVPSSLLSGAMMLGDLWGDLARGIATVPVTVTDGELAGLHDRGVRGLRFNLEYLVGVTVSMMEPLSKRIEPLGWHIQVNATARQLLAHRQLLANLSSPLVIDHMGQIPQPGGAEHAAFRMVEALVANGLTGALIVLAIVIGVMQLESHVLQPFLLGRSVRLHPVAVVLGIAAGLVSAGIIGGLLIEIAD